MARAAACFIFPPFHPIKNRDRTTQGLRKVEGFSLGRRKKAPKRFCGFACANSATFRNDNQDAAQAAFNEAAEDELPIVEVLPAGFRHAGQDTLFTVTPEADNQVNAGPL
jgi:hypothetical protein